MSSLIQLGNVQLLPVKEAAEFVPYSRDYVARLAREGKVVATQIDRQWFVDVTSLQNFFTHATIEETVRKRHLSSLRKRDLEVREVYRDRLAAIAEKRNAAERTTLVHTGLVVLCGLVAGFVFISANETDTFESVLAHAHLSGNAAVVKSLSATGTLPAMTGEVFETEDSFDISQGIVVLPGASSTGSVEDFFSDPVTVSMTSTTSGSIRNTVSNKAIPFVRVPSEATVVRSGTAAKTATP